MPAFAVRRFLALYRRQLRRGSSRKRKRLNPHAKYGSWLFACLVAAYVIGYLPRLIPWSRNMVHTLQSRSALPSESSWGMYLAAAAATLLIVAAFKLMKALRTIPAKSEVHSQYLEPIAPELMATAKKPSGSVLLGSQ